MLKSLLSILLLLSLSIGIGGIPPAGARTIEFQWSGDGGHRARGSFQYDENTAPAVIHEEGAGRTRVIETFVISFRDGSDREIARYDNVIDGVSRANYFRLNFDTRTGEFFGAIDLGGESAGETYLKGIVNDRLSLFQVGEKDRAMDGEGSPGIITALSGSESRDR